MKKEFCFEIRVRYSDTDKMGVVYYSNYFTWLEVARTEMFRSFGLDYRSIEKDKQLALPVIEAHCQYKSPARYDDIVLIETKISKMKNTSLRFDYNLINKDTGKLLALAYTTHVFIDKNRKPVKIPEEIKEVLKKSL